MARVLAAVARQHARPDDAAGREARIIDGERVCVAHHVQGELAAGNKPGVQDGDPREGAKLREDRMRVGLELFQGDARGIHFRHGAWSLPSSDSASSVETSATRS